MSYPDTNIVILIGRLVKDPELRYTQTGKAVVNFTVAVSNGKNSEGKEIPSCFFGCEAWEGMAKRISEYLAKGSQIHIEGKLIQRENKDKEGAKKYSSVRVLIKDIKFLNLKPKSEGAPETGKSPAEKIKDEFDGDYVQEDIPF